MRALRKKIRQAEGLAAKRAEGGALSAEEELKLAKLAAWWVQAAFLWKNCLFWRL